MKKLVVALFFCLFCSTQVLALTFTEDFSGPTINSFWWTPGTTNGNTLALDTNSQSLKMYQNTTSGTAGLTFNYQLVGDFEVTVDYKTYNWDLTGHDQQRIGLGCANIVVQRVSDWWFGGEIYLTYWSGASWTGGTPTTDTSGKLRLKRVGSTITGYFWDKNANGGAGGWAVAYYHGTSPAAPAPAQFGMGIWSGYSGTQIGNIIEWDNVYVNAPDTPNPYPLLHLYLPLVVKPGT
jgi:hypothetical protein